MVTNRSRKRNQCLDKWDAEWDLLTLSQAHIGRDSESVFSQINSDLQTAESFGIEMNLLPLGPKATATPEVERESE